MHNILIFFCAHFKLLATGQKSIAKKNPKCYNDRRIQKTQIAYFVQTNKTIALYFTKGGLRMTEFIKVILLGIIEGITEFLPNSSTGHLIIAHEFFATDTSSAFYEMFDVVIQLGAILAVIFLYFNKLNPFAPSKGTDEKRATWKIWFRVLIACLPAGIIGVLLNDWMDQHFFNFPTVICTLFIYGVLFILIENKNKNKTPSISSFSALSYKTAFYIGIIQCLSIIPGTSRSGSTILAAILLGCSREIAAEFSFFLSIPIMFGASTIKLLDFGFNFTRTELWLLITGTAVSFGVSLLAIRFLMNFVKKHNFAGFGVYRICLAALLLVYHLSK